MQKSDQEIERKVIEILNECFFVGRNAIETNSRLVEDLYIDSMGIVEIIIKLNEKFCTELPPLEVAQWCSVSDICFSLMADRDKRCR
ncbi:MULTISPECIES: acyl carrier protein [unclassified Pseudomonas]|uniref:acyl carrier protein n=1 Tax=unclassified Pseudomonas TaxID=196821 RepID=UPI001391E726|nr:MULTISPECIES: acyl carrier protein [unclassified Pseudomonas]KAI2682742.1 acyl carrier protein [Pseudomonas sp. TNT3]MBF4554993.1 acyl carrier protein [Pseudomonas sp. p50(2008)]